KTKMPVGTLKSWSVHVDYTTPGSETDRTITAWYFESNSPEGLIDYLLLDSGGSCFHPRVIGFPTLTRDNVTIFLFQLVMVRRRIVRYLDLSRVRKIGRASCRGGRTI